ncbi:hypothetical protein ET445_04000 [Agromyces protaetiae]|uniref:Uncharacterized protein n=1 Tax=Agromyces protaetiae TaxID=2509455 RepID=A0A4V0YGW5_9MICO|nr:hypothetical protein [Agromyces protaetiae]QAY72631.1 hypothetical protein ET445_04000 [Agromyces protaetiae]
MSGAGQARSARVYGQASNWAVVGTPPGATVGSAGGSVAIGSDASASPFFASDAGPGAGVGSTSPGTVAKFAGSSTSSNVVGAAGGRPSCV